MTTIPNMQELALALATELGGAVLRTDNERYAKISTRTGIPLSLYLHTYPKKLRISMDAPAYKNGKKYSDGTPCTDTVSLDGNSIELSWDREPKALARDIKRRMLNEEGEKAYADAVQKAAQWEAHYARTDSRKDDIVKRFRYRASKEGGGYLHSDGSGLPRLEINGEHIRVSDFYCTLEQLEAILATLGGAR